VKLERHLEAVAATWQFDRALLLTEMTCARETYRCQKH
jgi:hypothetical protein